MRRPFMALVWKEALEVSRHAAPMLVLSSILFYSSATGPIGATDSHPMRVFGWLGMFAPFVGAIFGFWQSYRESTGDIWSFAMHRPVSRHAVVGAKVVVGLAALLVVTTVPYAIAMWWQAMPGHVPAPFDRSLWLGGIADIVSGFMFYGAGLYAGARRSAVLTRGLGFAPAVLAMILTSDVASFWVALTIYLTVGLLLIASAWSTFISASDHEDQPLWGQVANVLTAATASFVAIGVLSMVVSALLPEPAPMRPVRAPRPHAFITGEGRLAVVQSIPSDSVPGLALGVVTDLAGRRLPEYNGPDGIRGIGRNVLVTSVQPIDTMSSWLRWRRPTYRSANQWVTRLFPMVGDPFWFYERRSGLISVYDRGSKRLQGWLGPDGYSAHPVKPRARFSGAFRHGPPGYPERRGYLVLSDAVYHLDGLAAPRLVFRAPAGETVIGADTSRWARSQEPPLAKASRFTLVTTDRRTYVLNAADSVELTSDHEPMGNAWNPQVSVVRAPLSEGNATFVWYSATFGDTLNRVLEFRGTSDSPVGRHVFPGYPWTETLGNLVAPGMAIGGMPAVSSVTFAAGYNIFPGLEVVSFGGRVPPEERAEVYRALMIATGVFLVLAAYTGWLCRRYAFSRERTVVWVALTALMGPLALLTMWLLLEWPARVPCASCARPRVVTRERCGHCNAPFPAPEPDGTEVFAV